MQRIHVSMEPSLKLLQSYANAECTLEDIASEQHKNWRVIYCYEQLAMEQDELVALQPATLIDIIMTQNASLMTFDLDAGP